MTIRLNNVRAGYCSRQITRNPRGPTFSGSPSEIVKRIAGDILSAEQAVRVIQRFMLEEWQYPEIKAEGDTSEEIAQSFLNGLRSAGIISYPRSR